MPRGLAHLWIVIHDLVSVVVRFSLSGLLRFKRIGGCLSNPFGCLPDWRPNGIKTVGDGGFCDPVCR